MIQLTLQQREELRKRAQDRPDLVASMKASVKTLMEEPVLVPTSGIANWTLYYYCPHCSVQLTFDWRDGAHHRCPQCGEVFTGEPYDSSWWGLTNGRNYNGAVTMGWLYAMTGEKPYANKARDILAAYAKNYPNYEVHGNIPYNGPGRSGAQTLDEANFQRNLAIAFDLVRETLTDAEQTRMREDMFLPGAQFLMQHRHNQLHNHEVIINSAIAIIGMLFEREDMIDFALHTPYGLLYQLEHGMLENGMWFEGSFGYHFYALTSFLAYEKFALNTKYSHMHHPNYTKMMNFAFDYVQPDGVLPMLGDTNYEHLKSMLRLYEFTYRELREEKMLYMLHLAYRDQKRDSLEAVIYGVDELPPCPPIVPPAQVHPEPGHSGHTLLRAEDGRFLLFKHDPYGGEHDHYDRLGISAYALGVQAAPDIGTTGYGAVMHYDYYKNTGAHNTVVISEENQSPANAVMTRFEERDGGTYVEAVCDWHAPFTMPDTFTIVQWDEEAYRHVKMTRRIAWTQDYFAERFDVENVEAGRTIDWVLHLPGTRRARAEEQPVERLSCKKPYKYLHDMTREDGAADSMQTVVQQEGTTRVFCAAFGGERLMGVGPGNPSYTDLAYIIERMRGGRASFAHVIETSRGDGIVQDVRFDRAGDALRIRVNHRDGSARVIEL
ncbi:MAG: heparinase II/III family protein [Aristaeellaceae bacterium]